MKSPFKSGPQTKKTGSKTRQTEAQLKEETHALLSDDCTVVVVPIIFLPCNAVHVAVALVLVVAGVVTVYTGGVVAVLIFNVIVGLSTSLLVSLLPFLPLFNSLSKG